ncbi:ribosomal protection-like ABC-F family protein [Carnobacterium gallinarum]|uniref:ribosomal protection-like ABC-F family protein n=1 Tax=Carnobacterium gallinarum TaxID=2749 RepID=UPI00054FF206|nr:ABC-F family ATP-binding cassette domain-containing protein [Carnobacterium gallinarum]
MLVEVKNSRKAIGEKLLFDIPNWSIYAGERIGIVGRNGEGKTTLLNVIAKRSEADSGEIQLNGSIGFIEQLPDQLDTQTLSGGEATKQRIQDVFQMNPGIIFADEPTSHLDRDGRRYLEKAFRQFQGGALIVSHDRDFLNQVCTKIVELEAGKVGFYQGNYDAYQQQKKNEIQTAEADYQAYEKEKKRLAKVADATHRRAEKVRNAPRRMGNSEARLHKMGNQRAKKKLGEAVENIESRMEHLEVKKKPVHLAPIKIKMTKGQAIHQDIVLSGSKVSKKFDKRILLNEADFTLYNHSRTALIGGNGVGKTTLIQLILADEAGIQLAKNVHFGYFSQKLDSLDDEETLVANVMKESVHNEDFVRMLLARLLFKGQDVFKKVKQISGGERNKISMAKLLVSGANVLIFDEPTNYLDIASIEAIEEAMLSYEGTILFVSHDQTFVETVATHRWELKEQKVKMSLVEPEPLEMDVQLQQATSTEKQLLPEERMLIENKISGLLGRISMPHKKDNVEKLEAEYQELLKQLK